MGNKESGLQLLAGVFEALPEDLRTQAKTVFESEQAAKAVDVLGAGALRHDDYSRQADKARQTQEAAEARQAELEAWFAPRKAVLTKYDELVEAGTIKPGDPLPLQTPSADITKPNGSTPDLSKVVTQDDFRAAQGDVLGLFAVVTPMVARHLHEFNEVLDVESLLKHPKVHQVGLKAVYEEVYRDRYQKKTEEAEQARVAKLRTEIEADVRKQYANTNFPYPVRPSGSPLDGLEAKQAKDGSGASLDMAVTEYERLVAARPL